MSDQPPAIDHMAGYKVLGDTSLGTAKALIRIGGAAGTQEVPAWADTLLGIYAHLSPSTITTVEDTVAWGYLESDDGMSIKPFEFLYPPIGAPLGATGRGNATKGEYYPVNAPVRPLSKIIGYGQWISGAAATTAAAYAAITFWFSNSRASGQWAGTNLDPHPGVQRYRKIGTYTAVPSSASGYAAEAAYQCNLGQGGGVITELLGMATDFTPVAGLAGGGTFRFTSNDVPLMPNTFSANAFGSLIGATGELDYRDIITRRPCHMEADSVVTLENSYLQGAGKTGTTGDFITGVEFVRA
jgi:hypothetical protein